MVVFVWGICLSKWVAFLMVHGKISDTHLRFQGKFGDFKINPDFSG